jgi:hypothetical protein
MAAKVENSPKTRIDASRSLQRKGIATVLFLMLALVAFESLAQEDEKFYTECAIAQGDSLDKVKQFYRIPVDPQKSEPPTPYRYLYHLGQYGVWVFFDEQLRVSNLRFDAPFRGQIGGVAIGDAAARVLSLRGEPTHQLQGLVEATQVQMREQQVQTVLKALPDPVPKSKVLEIVAEINRIRTAPLKFNTAWVYGYPPGGDPTKPSYVRYEIGPDDNKVQSILLNSCSQPRSLRPATDHPT